MNSHATRAADIEASFLAGAEHNLNEAKERRFRGTKWLWSGTSQEDRLRDLMAAHGRYDRELLRSLPKNAARIMTCIEPCWLLWERPAGVAIAAFLSPIEFYVGQAGTPAAAGKTTAVDETAQPPPIGLAELRTFIRQLVGGDAKVPYLVGVCSPTGFTDEAKRLGVDLANVAVVLVEPRADGGWTTTCASPKAQPADARLFDPEAVSRKLTRVREEVNLRRADLLTGGLRASAVGERLGLSAGLVTRAFEHLAADGELRVSREGDDALLFLGAPAAMEEYDMSMVEWIRQLFGREGDETRKINALAERRAKLASRRDRLYEDAARLEGREAELMAQGRQTSSAGAKRRIATQIKQLRDDMERMQAAARMVGQQIDVISTHIHSLTLIQQGQAAKLPSSEEITQDAVRAEEMLEQLSGQAELASSLGGAVQESSLSDDELAILRELEGPAADREADKPQPQDRLAADDQAAPRRQREGREPQAG
ncbi:MAG: hypothetical protein HY718_08685 [Planctomycetes bacterium]|nr:hypothetical protein [Planctomycetota bacterium]